MEKAGSVALDEPVEQETSPLNGGVPAAISGRETEMKNNRMSVDHI